MRGSVDSATYRAATVEERFRPRLVCRNRRGGRAYKQRGSQVVEFGLVLVPFCAFIFLLMDLSWAIFVKATMQYAVREGVRYAVTGQTISGSGQDASIKTTVQQNAMGFLNGPAGAAKIFIRYYLPDTLVETAVNAGGNLVEISGEGYSLTPLGPILRSSAPLILTARSSDRVESSPGGVAPSR
ncbi:MAG: pilus assembly protein [Acidobacteriota bacterium]|nr:pilus assembly protein [Acidobacteriota bacterium]